MDHIHLARWADVFVLCPATANSISQWASGSAADLPSALYLAFEKSKPLLIAPAMNKEMWSHPAVKENLRRLVEWNVRVIEPEAGSLACGEIGAGRLASPDRIIAEIEAAAARPRSRGHVLVTSGATREAIDSVRFISNVSSGRTGAALAEQFAFEGFDVVYLHGPGAIMPANSLIETHEFSNFRSLAENLRRLLQRPFQSVVHAAAVSDFSVAEIESDGAVGGKLNSDRDLTLRLKRNPKLVLNLKEWSVSPAPIVFAFKLTDTDDEGERKRAVEHLLSRSEVDAVAWNDLKDVKPDRHIGRLYTKSGEPAAFSNNRELGEKIMELVRRGSQ